MLKREALNNFSELGSFGKPPDVPMMLLVAGRDRVVAAINLYRQMQQRYPAEFFRERILNALGYEQLNSKHIQEAIALFKLNVEMYPNSFNTYDSLGEAYMVAGEREEAIQNYRKSLALNPDNTNAVDMLKKLGAAH